MRISWKAFSLGMAGLALVWCIGAGCRPAASADPLNVFTAESFAREVGPGSGLVVIDFWAPWCGPCRRVAPVLHALSEEYAGRITFGKVNVDEQPVLAEKFKVSSIPCLILFRDGQALDALIGARSAPEYREWFNRFLPAVPVETSS